MIRAPILAALTLFAATPTLPQSSASDTSAPAPRSYPVIERIDWTYGAGKPGDGSGAQLRFSREGSMSSLGSGDAPDIMGELAPAALANPGAAVSFSLAREAGALACTGRVAEIGRAGGTCRFDPDEHYAAELAHRGLFPEDSEEMLALTLVDGRIALVDGLMGLGYRFEDTGDLIAVAALDATPAFAAELRDAGLAIGELDDLIAARALGIDAEWLTAMARAGYPDLEVEQAIQMRALGVTPDYARRMSRVLSALGEVQ